MRLEPPVKRAIAFIDGQNLFHGAREAFGYTYPNYDVLKLANAVCTVRGWSLVETHFYTGVPDAIDNARWSAFWAAKLLWMSRGGVETFSRPLRYRNKTFKLPDGNEHTILVGEEKGIDVRLAIDIVRLGNRKAYDVALVFSQDQDLSEVADEVKAISIQQSRWILMASAFPVSPTSRNRRGINGTEWIRVDKTTYDACIDPRDHRPGATTTS